MKYILLLLIFNIGFAQNEYPIEPENYKKIHFIYQKSSKFTFEDDFFYGDTLLIKSSFPKLKFEKLKSPKDSTLIIGKVNFEILNKEEKKIIESIYYHSTETFTGTYNKASDKTNISVSRKMNATSKTLKKWVNSLSNFYYNIEINYKSTEINTIYPSVSYTKNFVEGSKRINYLSENHTNGTCKFIENSKLCYSYVLLNTKLNNKIIPGLVFQNNDYGVEVYEDLNIEYVLIDVKYE